MFKLDMFVKNTFWTIQNQFLLILFRKIFDFKGHFCHFEAKKDCIFDGGELSISNKIFSWGFLLFSVRTFLRGRENGYNWKFSTRERATSNFGEVSKLLPNCAIIEGKFGTITTNLVVNGSQNSLHIMQGKI